MLILGPENWALFVTEIACSFCLCTHTCDLIISGADVTGAVFRGDTGGWQTYAISACVKVV